VTEEVCEVIITAPDSDWLADFTRRLVEERLAAGAHNIASIRSVYRWRSQIEDRPEARVALHTRRSLVPEIVQFTNRHHPYEVPCIVAWPITDGNPEYIAWIVAETRSPQPAAPTKEQV
jgi:periplasmic divalent cation tolerance protein